MYQIEKMREQKQREKDTKKTKRGTENKNN